MNRRAFLAVALATLSVACKRGASSGPSDDRCAFCGMRIDPASAWRAELVTANGATVRFDTPRCAFLAWRTGKTAAKSIRAQEFYERAWRDGAELRFAIGSDVLGPMGPDVVPIDPARAAKFTADHAAARILTLDEVTAQAIESAS